MKQAITALLKVKSILTLILTAALCALLLIPSLHPPESVLALFCTSYGAVITYFFTRKKEDGSGDI
jgi:hypothetical protein